MNPSNQRNNYPPWSPRFWNGMRIGDYLELVWQGGMRIHPWKVPMFLLGTGVSILNSGLAGLQTLALSKKIEKVTLQAPPIFIIGHWRSGTTLMHELLTLDQRLGYPNNFDAFTPHHLLLSRPVLYPLINLLLPGKRPMDAMSLSANSPQEDDFALVSMGAPTMYRDIAFPNQRFTKPIEEQPAEQEKVRIAMTYFLKVLTMQYRKPLVLKSPPHTRRIRELSEWFPDAKFVHVSRNPYKLVPSTIKLWKALDATQGFQIPNYTDDQLIDYVQRHQAFMYNRYSDSVNCIPQGNLLEIRFEDLIADPVQTTARIYEQWSLGEFDPMVQRIQHYFATRKAIQPGQAQLSGDWQEKIAVGWEPYFRLFGYRP